MQNSIKNFGLWLDTDGNHINAHGGGILFYKGVYYWHGEHKIAGEAGNCAQVGVGVYSSTDLYNWKNEGIALSVSNDENSPITKGCILERPKVVYNEKTRKFVMWFHLELKDQGYSAAMAGTAVADSPTGPFHFVEAFRMNAGIWPQNVQEQDKIPSEKNYLERDFNIGQMSRDMNLFVDDDGTAYHITSAEENGTCHISKLCEDYLHSSGEWVRLFPNRMMEAHAICKRHGTYHYIASGCTGWAPNQARSAHTQSLLGSWTELENPCRGVNPSNGQSGQDLTYGGQSTFMFKVEGTDRYIAMFDIWNKYDAIDGRYLWLPLTFDDTGYHIDFQVEWNI